MIHIQKKYRFRTAVLSMVFLTLVQTLSGQNPGGIVQTGAPIVVADEIAIVSGTVNPEGVNANISIEYGTTQSLGSVVNTIPSTSSANTDVAVSAQLPGLSPGTTYYYRVKSTNVQGDGFGRINSFTTLAADTDGDGVLNALDLDDDNDVIPTSKKRTSKFRSGSSRFF